MAVSVGIVGAGVSGLALGHHLRRILEQSGAEHELFIYEKSDRVGGSISSGREDGFLIEWGPNGFLNNEQATFELIRDLGLRDRLVVSRDAARKRFILIDGRLNMVPVSPGSAVKTGILPLSAKLRFAMEPFIAKGAGDRDESVASFVARRFGKQAVARMFDPLVSGVYAGDAEKLSINSTLKVFAELERERGSVVRGMFARVKQRRAEARTGVEKQVDELFTTSKNPMSGKLLSFGNGMVELINALRDELADNIHTGTAIESVTSARPGYELVLRTPGGTTCRRHDVLVFAAPPQGAAPLLAPVDAELGRVLGDIPSSTITVLGLGFRGDDIGSPLDGFGYLIPRNQKLRSLGVLWSSSIFPGRAPEGGKLLQIMIGGAHDPKAVEEDDKTLVDTALRDADPLLRFKGAPVVARVVRHRAGIPQYNLGHRDRLAQIARRLESLPGLHLTGNGYHGISANDCIRCARDLAAKIAAAHNL